MARITLPREPAVVYGELAPAQEMVNVECNAEEIGGDKAKRSRSDAAMLRRGKYPREAQRRVGV